MNIRPAAVAGLFYPAHAHELRAMICPWLEVADPDVQDPKALIVPHAGYIYSGPTAACAFATLAPQTVRHVILFGPAHRVPVRGMALPESEAFATPLGHVPLDNERMQRALAHPAVCRSDIAHAMEHSLEVQLPFLQAVLAEFTLTPIVVGDAAPEAVAEVMASLWDNAQTLILISSDLSHYHPYDEARQLDRQTIEAILSLQADIDHRQACGATGINGLLLQAAARGLQPHLLDYRNSGDTAGDKQQVVGYTAIAFKAKEHTDEC